MTTTWLKKMIESVTYWLVFELEAKQSLVTIFSDFGHRSFVWYSRPYHYLRLVPIDSRSNRTISWKQKLVNNVISCGHSVKKTVSSVPRRSEWTWLPTTFDTFQSSTYSDL